MVNQDINYMRMGLISFIISFFSIIMHFIFANRNGALDIYESIFISIIIIFGIMSLIFFTLYNNEIQRKKE